MCRSLQHEGDTSTIGNAIRWLHGWLLQLNWWVQELCTSSSLKNACTL